ncbi:MAG: Yip1 family protein [Bryobacteraceae bacterium]|jgi:hypothetical protein
MPEIQAAPAAAPKSSLSELGRLTNVFIEPRRTFQDLVERPRWIVPVVLMTVLALAFAIAMGSHVGWDRIVRQGMEASERTQNMPPEQREQAVAIGVKFASIGAYGGAVLAVPAILLISAGVLLLVFKGLLSAKLRFKQVFAICAYASLPGLINSLASLAVMLLKAPEDFDPQRPTVFNIGYYLDPSTAKWLMALASSIDVFTIWVILLMATGLRVASRKLSFAQSVAGVALPWVLVVIIKIGWAALRG